MPLVAPRNIDRFELQSRNNVVRSALFTGFAEVGRLEAMIDSAEKRDVEVTRLSSDLQERDSAYLQLQKRLRDVEDDLLNAESVHVLLRQSYMSETAAEAAAAAASHSEALFRLRQSCENRRLQDLEEAELRSEERLKAALASASRLAVTQRKADALRHGQEIEQLRSVVAEAEHREELALAKARAAEAAVMVAKADSEAVSNAALRRSEEQRDAKLQKSQLQEQTTVITSLRKLLRRSRRDTTSALDTAQTEAGAAEKARGRLAKVEVKAEEAFEALRAARAVEKPKAVAKAVEAAVAAEQEQHAAVLAGAVAAERRERVAVVEAVEARHRAELALADERVSMAEGRADAAEKKAATAAEAARVQAVAAAAAEAESLRSRESPAVESTRVRLLLKRCKVAERREREARAALVQAMARLRSETRRRRTALERLAEERHSIRVFVRCRPFLPSEVSGFDVTVPFKDEHEDSIKDDNTINNAMLLNGGKENQAASLRLWRQSSFSSTISYDDDDGDDGEAEEGAIDDRYARFFGSFEANTTPSPRLLQRRSASFESTSSVSSVATTEAFATLSSRCCKGGEKMDNQSRPIAHDRDEKSSKRSNIDAKETLKKTDSEKSLTLSQNDSFNRQRRHRWQRQRDQRKTLYLHQLYSPLHFNMSDDQIVTIERPNSFPITAADTQTFEFDRCFGPTSTQTKVFEETLLPLLPGFVLRGRDLTALAYGPTGSGKTFTMSGRMPLKEKNDETNLGVCLGPPRKVKKSREENQASIFNTSRLSSSMSPSSSSKSLSPSSNSSVATVEEGEAPAGPYFADNDSIQPELSPSSDERSSNYGALDENEDDSGMIQRAIREAFSVAAAAENEILENNERSLIATTFTLSYLEIYCERVFDLLEGVENDGQCTNDHSNERHDIDQSSDNSRSSPETRVVGIYNPRWIRSVSPSPSPKKNQTSPPLSRGRKKSRGRDRTCSPKRTSTTRRSLSVRSAASGGVSGLSQHRVESPADVDRLVQYGIARRSFGATSSNQRSSRSHAVLTLTCHRRRMNLSTTTTSSSSSNNSNNGHSCVNIEDKFKIPRVQQRATTVSRMHLVDLAGSERVAKSGASDERLREALAINKSLAALGDVMGALYRNSMRKRMVRAAFAGHCLPSSLRQSQQDLTYEHVPYRNSKLTFLLSGSLEASEGGRIVMFCNVSPHRSCGEETASSFQFASRCRSVLLDPIPKVP